jgi:hypothetical protein
MYRAAWVVLLGVALLSGARPDSKAGLPPNAQEVTGDVHQYAEALRECSPDGRWLALEYNRMSDPTFLMSESCVWVKTIALGTRC